MEDRKGQFSTYLKPILVVVFGMLMVLVVQQILSFQLSIGEEQASIQFVSQMRRDFQKITGCSRYRGDGGARYVLSKKKLEDWSQNYEVQEPECAEDYDYGYSVEIESKCGLLSTGVSCEDFSYSFGEKEGSTDRALENSFTISFPVLVRHQKSNVPATLDLTLRDGELEMLAGGLDKVIMKGEELGEFNMTLSISTEKYHCSSGELVCSGRTDENCVRLRDQVPPFSLQPGSHVLRMSYRDGEFKEIRGVTSSEGCSS